jgi:hypothetical protein
MLLLRNNSEMNDEFGILSLSDDKRYKLKDC